LPVTKPVLLIFKGRKTMKKLLVAALTVMTLTQANAQRTHRAPRIVGGEPVKDYAEVSYMVSLSGVCGGSIIGSRWVLTAAHCAGHFQKAQGGTLDLKQPGQVYQVKKVTVHPAYSTSKSSNDFAVAELDRDIDFTRTNLRPIRLATPEMEAAGIQKPDTPSIVYGWGNIKEGVSNRDKILMQVMLPIVSNEEANRPEGYNGKVDSTMIAAGYINGGKDSCQGDSGGPMVVKTANGPVQVGVVSWGHGCARPYKYGIYGKVSAGYEWIKSVVGLRANDRRFGTDRRFPR
jgi:secreted trypsin-like serine protease